MKPDYKKITQLLNYIAQKNGGNINYMKALKLLYLADRLHLRMYGRFITNDSLIAMKNGTLGSMAKDIVIQNKFLPYVIYNYSKDKLKRDKFNIATSFNNLDDLSETDLECVDKVWSILGKKDRFYLAKLTHKLPEWKRCQYPIESKEKLVMPIEVLDLFGNADNEELNKIYNQTEKELEISKEFFEEILNQTECFV